MPGTFALALYGAIVATLVGVGQVMLDRLKIRVFDRRHPPHPGVAVEIMNRGRRPTGISWVGLFQPEDTSHIVSEIQPVTFNGEKQDVTGPLPVNNSVDFFLDQDLPHRARLVVRDAAGRWWPRYRRPRLWMRARRLDYRHWRSR